MADQNDMPMATVIYLTKEGRPARPIKSVLGAIDFINDDLDDELAEQPAFVRAKEALHRALERTMTVEEARLAFIAALRESKRLWT
jgi:hypothetical protein